MKNYYGVSMLTHKLHTFRSYFRSSTKKYVLVLEMMERYTGNCYSSVQKIVNAFGSQVSQQNERKKNSSYQALIELRSCLIGPFDRLRSEFRDYHEHVDKFRIVIFGQLNSGKSYLANFLVGKDVPGLKQESISLHAVTSDGQIVELDEFEVKPTEATKEIQWCDLETLRVVDLPGVGSISPRNQALAVDYVKRADLVLLLSNSDAVLRGSEFKHLRDDLYGERKRIVYVITQCDMLKDFDSEERIPLPKRDIQEMVKYIQTTLRNPKYGVHNILKSLDVVPVSVRLARIGVELENQGERRKGIEKQKQSNLATLIDTIINIISDEGRMLRILTPMRRTLITVNESMSAIEQVYRTLNNIALCVKKALHRLEQCRSVTASSSSRELENLRHFLRHRRFRMAVTLDRIFSNEGAQQTLRDQQASAVMMQKEFEDDVRDELHAKVTAAFERYKKDMVREYNSFIDEFRKEIQAKADEIRSAENNSPGKKETASIVLSFIERSVIPPLDSHLQTRSGVMDLQSLLANVKVAYDQPIHHTIIFGFLSNFGAKFYKRKERLKKVVKTMVFRGLDKTEEKAKVALAEYASTISKQFHEPLKQQLLQYLTGTLNPLIEKTQAVIDVSESALEELKSEWASVVK